MSKDVIDHLKDDSGAYLHGAMKARYRARVLGILAVAVLAAVLVNCGGRRGGGHKPPPKPVGTTGGGTPPPPGATRMTLEELRTRQKALAQALVLHPADKSGSRTVLALARGGGAAISGLPVDYWDADIAWRMWARAKAAGNTAEVRSGEQWFERWLRMRAGEWAGYPSGSQNHTWAQALGPYAAVQVLGQARANAIASGVANHAVPTMRALVMDGTWPCCGNHDNARGEITGSRHYHIRSWSDMAACADLCADPLATKAGADLDRAVAFLRGKVRPDGVWPEDLIPQVRAERDDLCSWPAAEFQRTKYPFLTKHPAFTPHTSYLVLSYVKTPNLDFIGHYKPSACRGGNPPDWCSHIGGQGAYKDECDERSEVNNVGLLLAGDRWRPIR